MFTNTNEITSAGILFVFFTAVIAVMIPVIAIKNNLHAKRHRAFINSTKLFINSLYNEEKSAVKTAPNRKTLMTALLSVCSVISCDKETAAQISETTGRISITAQIIRNLKSFSARKNLTGLKYSQLLDPDESLLLLNEMMKKKKSRAVHFYCSYMLSLLGDYSSIPLIIASMKSAPEWMMYRYFSVLNNFDKSLLEYLTALQDIDDRYIILLIIYYARTHPSNELRDFIISYSKHDSTEIQRSACEALLTVSPEILMNSYYSRNADSFISACSFHAYRNADPYSALMELSAMLHDTGKSEEIIETMKMIIQKNPEHIPYFIEEYTRTSDHEYKKDISRIISGKIEYFTLKINSQTISQEELKLHEDLIIDIISQNNCNEFISFINRNNDGNFEKKTVPLVQKAMEINPEIKENFSMYVKDEYLDHLGIKRQKYTIQRTRKEKFKLRYLYIFLFTAILFFPVIFLSINYRILQAIHTLTFFKNFIVFYCYGFSWYSIILNSVYVTILILSLTGMTRQKRMWEYKTERFLFFPEILPSVSIIAPAYGEESTIVDSVNSLLNLKYPNFEIIIVNDGSKDNTLKRLIEHYELERIDSDQTGDLETAPVTGTYKNAEYPNLIVVDKINGGKADSLNAGINYASCTYFCGIDADSLLETDSLLKLASQFIDYDTETIASGGNILPANSCIIDKGNIESITIPENFLARMQTVEYLRSFMTGRIGWSEIQGLLIISGAFGFFKRDAVINAGGYLTEKSRFNKNTVGEDMELVVRLIKTANERKDKFRINYAFNANCWTEVPEKYNILKRQRDRWHRGLLDIISYHFDLLFNFRNKCVGFIAFPYFILFEIIGPFFEVFAIVFLISGIALNAISSDLFLILFSSSILYGIIVTLTSIMISQAEKPIFNTLDTLKLALFTFFENFGYRQVINFIRISAFFNALRRKSGWGEMQRKGFRKS